MGSTNNVPFPPTRRNEKNSYPVSFTVGAEPRCQNDEKKLLQMISDVVDKKGKGFETLFKDVVEGKGQIGALERELEETKVAEEKQIKDSNSIRLEELGITDSVKKKHVNVIAKKLEGATQTLNNEWQKQHGKWKSRLERVSRENESVLKFIQEFGIKPISDEETGQFSGIGLSSLDPRFPEYEGVVYFSEFNTADWSFKEVLSVEPTFPEWRTWMEEANRRKDLAHTLSTVRRHWVTYFASTIGNGSVDSVSISLSLSSTGEDSSLSDPSDPTNLDTLVTGTRTDEGKNKPPSCPMETDAISNTFNKSVLLFEDEA